jgi:hypothetical protein
LSLDLSQKYGALYIIMPRASEVPLNIVMNKTWDKNLSMNLSMILDFANFLLDFSLLDFRGSF